MDRSDKTNMRNKIMNSDTESRKLSASIWINLESGKNKNNACIQIMDAIIDAVHFLILSTCSLVKLSLHSQGVPSTGYVTVQQKSREHEFD
jgi:hypothetical protein